MVCRYEWFRIRQPFHGFGNCSDQPHGRKTHNSFSTKVFHCLCHWKRSICWPSLKSALRPPPSAQAESANFRPFYVKRADFSPPPPATKKRRKLVKIRPRCPHLATKQRRKVVKIRPCGGWWVGGWPPPLFA